LAGAIESLVSEVLQQPCFQHVEFVVAVGLFKLSFKDFKATFVVYIVSATNE